LFKVYALAATLGFLFVVHGLGFGSKHSQNSSSSPFRCSGSSAWSAHQGKATVHLPSGEASLFQKFTQSLHLWGWGWSLMI